VKNQYFLELRKRKQKLDKGTIIRIIFYLRRMRFYDELSREFHGIKRLAAYYESISNGYVGKIVAVLNQAKKKGGA